MERCAEFGGLQEIKAKATAIRRMVKEFEAKGWKLICGKSNEQSEQPSAGVGAMAKGKQMTCPLKITEAFKKAAEAARVEQFELDFGWGKPTRAFILYGET